MSSNFLFRSFRILLFPFALVYGCIIMIRNYLYDKQIFKSVKFNLPIIDIGNLSVGGTGKSPMVVFLIKHLQNKYKIAILSRGYRRKTKGYLLATPNRTALDIGDEPLMFYNQFPDVSVAVGEERVLAVPQLLQDRPNTQVIILDDAFQHRAIVPSFHILLTDYKNLYINDFFLPTGDLRDEKKSIHRANVVVVSKCPNDLTINQAKQIESELKLKNSIPIFFSCIEYALPKHLFNNGEITLNDSLEVLLVTGIANPKPIEKLLEDKVKLYEKIHYNDHHVFDVDDVKNIEKQFNHLQDKNKIILTTQKDAMRLLKFGNAIEHLPIYILPIEIKFLFDKQNQLLDMVIQSIDSYKTITSN